MKQSLKLALLMSSVCLADSSYSAVSSYNTAIVELDSKTTLKIDQPLHFNLRSSRDLSESAMTTLNFNKGTFLGNNGFYIPPLLE